MDEIRLFIKNQMKNQYKLSIKYEENKTIYKYKFENYILHFEELEDLNINLKLHDKTYSDILEIQLCLFELFNYMNFEYIDIYLQNRVNKKRLIIDDIYNDYYDDYNNEFIAKRYIKSLNLLLKFVLKNDNFHLYINTDEIIGFDNIIEKINEII